MSTTGPITWTTFPVLVAAFGAVALSVAVAIYCILVKSQAPKSQIPTHSQRPIPKRLSAFNRAADHLVSWRLGSALGFGSWSLGSDHLSAKETPPPKPPR